MARWVVVVGVFIALAACRKHESMTGVYGAGVVTGQVVMAAGTSASPAGVRVSVVGTGMSTLLGPDGHFAFNGVPQDAELHFMRDDGIDARIAVPAGMGSVVVELNGKSAKAGKKRAVPSNPPIEIEGVIVTAAADSLVVHSSHNEDVTVQLTDATVIRHGQTPIKAADLKTGDRVHVKATVKEDVKTAIEVIVQDQGEDTGDDNGGTTMTANGVVKSVGSDSLVVTTVPKGDVTVQADDSTIIRKQGALIKLADIHVGDEVNTMGTKVDDQTLKAVRIEVRGKGKGHS
jgi:ribosomal protein L19